MLADISAELGKDISPLLQAHLPQPPLPDLGQQKQVQVKYVPWWVSARLDWLDRDHHG